MRIRDPYNAFTDPQFTKIYYVLVCTISSFSPKNTRSIFFLKSDDRLIGALKGYVTSHAS